MDIDVAQVSLFLAILAVVAQTIVVLAAVLAVVARRWLGPVRDTMTGMGVPFALVVAAIATSGSLYFSEIAHFVPCRLCWWQRYAMYPLVPILLLAWLRPTWRLWRLAAPMALVGTAIAAYHVVIERWPTLEVTSCSRTNPCTIRWVEEFGYVTIPVMSLSAFVLILTWLALDPTHSIRRSRP